MIDLDAYCARVGYDGPRDPTLDTLRGDHEAGSWFVSTHPESIFVTGLMGARAEPDRRYALGNNQLSIHHMNGKSEKRALNARELRAALTDLFKLRLDQLEGLDPVLAKLAAASA